MTSRIKRFRRPNNPEKADRIISTQLTKYHGKINNTDILRAIHKAGWGSTLSTIKKQRAMLGFKPYRGPPTLPEKEPVLEKPEALVMAAAADPARDSMWEDLVNHLDKMGVGELHYTRADGKAKLTIHRVQVVEFE